MVIDETLNDIRNEAERGAGKYGPPTSAHESLGVLLEEFEELKEAIHANDGDHIYREAVQVAAVAYRLALEVSRADLAFFYRSGLNPKAKRTA